MTSIKLIRQAAKELPIVDVPVGADGKFVYVLLRPNGVPFYVGKGGRVRAFQHARKSARVRNVINKIKRNGRTITVTFVFKSFDESAVFAEEKRLIALFGRKEDGGCLYNFTEGGEGPTHPECVKKLLRRSAQKRWKREKEHEKSRRAHVALWQDEGYRTKLTQAHVGKTHTLSARSKRKIGDANKRAYADPIVRKALSDSKKNYLSEHPDELRRLQALGRASCAAINAGRS